MKKDHTHIEISGTSLSLDACNAFIMDPTSGGNCIFIGNVRNNTDDKEVIKLEFESFEEMAISELKKIASTVSEEFSICKLYIAHRTGSLLPGETAVIIGVSSKHRDAAFKACRYTIDKLKETVPIWKKEFFTDGESWVNARP